MKKLLFLLMMALLYITASAQIQFAPIGAEWYYTYGESITEHFNHAVVEKDTMVEGKSCRIVMQYYDDSDSINGKFIITQEQGKVYHYYLDQFHLLFDFDAKEADTVKFTFMYRQGYYSAPPYERDTILSVRYYVEKITINAQDHKTFKTTIIDEDAYLPHLVSYLPSVYTYTEKIGWHDNDYLFEEFMPRCDNLLHPDIQIFRFLRCYADSEYIFISVFWEERSLPCDYSILSNVNTLENGKVKVYPNPFTDHISISTPHGERIKITDVLGKVLYDSKLSGETSTVSTNNFPRGIFLVEIQTKNNEIQTFKMLKL